MSFFYAKSRTCSFIVRNMFSFVKEKDSSDEGMTEEDDFPADNEEEDDFQTKYADDDEAEWV